MEDTGAPLRRGERWGLSGPDQKSWLALNAPSTATSAAAERSRGGPLLLEPSDTAAGRGDACGASSLGAWERLPPLARTSSTAATAEGMASDTGR